MEEKYSVIRVDDDEVDRLNNALTESELWSKRSIYRVPEFVTKLNEQAYKPRIVSLGPYHHGLSHLMPMEKHKERALNHFLLRVNRTSESLVSALTPFVQDIKDAYDQLDPKWIEDDDAFLKMMIMDGCFVLELLRTTQAKDQPVGSISHDYARNDPVFSKHGKLYILPYLRPDMLMLENQIPMKVLEELFSIQHNNLPDQSQKDRELTRLILDFFSQGFHDAILECKRLHMLGVYRHSLLLVLEEPRPLKRWSMRGPIAGRDEIFYSARELHEAGISIQNSRTRSLKDITFSGGVLRLPLIVVDDSLESLYLNMIAYERFHVGAGNDVTSYIFFMDSIIHKAKDVSFLHECNIIMNTLGGDKAVVNIFNSLSKDITLDPDSDIYQVHGKVSSHCRKPWSKCRAWLWRNYFKHPWASISFLASILLFALTCTQTLYTVLPYSRPNSSSKL